MSSDSIQFQQQISHHNQQLNNHSNFGYQTTVIQQSEHIRILANEYQHDDPMEGPSSMLSDSIIRGNMQYIDGELKKIPRPLNAFMIFSNEKRKELKREFPGEPNNMISSRLGAAWKELSDDLRKKYHDMAHREDLEHRRKYPNYQYCPGHARKLKKARREQRLRQQGVFRTTRQSADAQRLSNNRKKGEVGRPKGSTSTKKDDNRPSAAKKEQCMESYVGSAAPKKSSTNHVVHGVPISVTGSSSMLPGPCGEGRCGMTAAPGFVPPINTSADCMLTCCGGCPPADSYCCPEAHWTTDPIAAAQGFAPISYHPSMFYFSPNYDAHLTNEPVVPQPCLVPGDCSGFYSPIGYMDAGCYGPVYPGIGANAASGDGGVLCKDMFTPNDIPMTTQPSEVKSVGSVALPVEDGDQSELVDISCNTVVSCSQDSQSCTTTSESYSISPSTLQEISPSSMLCEGDLTELADI